MKRIWLPLLWLLAVVPAWSTVYLWDFDNYSTFFDTDGSGILFGDEEGIKKGLSNNGYTAVVVGETLPPDLSSYDAVFATLGSWCFSCDDRPPSTINPDDRLILQNYLEQGGKLYLEGVNAVSSLQDTNLYPFLGTSFAGTPYEFGVSSVTGTNNLPDGNNTWGYPTGGNAAYSLDALMPTPGLPLLRDQDGNVRATFYEHDGYKIIVSSLIFGAISNGDFMGRQVLMHSYMQLLGLSATAANNNAPEHSTGIAAWPNPYSQASASGIKIRLQATAPGPASVKVFDARGRVVYAQTVLRSGSEDELSWKPKGLPNGVYFYQIKSGKNEKITKLLLLK